MLIKKIMEHEGIDDPQRAEKELQLIEEALVESKEDPRLPGDLEEKDSISTNGYYTHDEYHVLSHASDIYFKKKGIKKYNNFWTYLKRAQGITSPERFIEIHKDDIEMWDFSAKESSELGEFYTGPIEMKPNITLEDVIDYYLNMYKKALGSGKFPESDDVYSEASDKRHQIDGEIGSLEYAKVKIRIAKDTEEVCQEIGYQGGAEEAYEKFIRARGYTGEIEEYNNFSPVGPDSYPDGTTGLDIILEDAGRKKTASEILKQIFEELRKKGYTEKELWL